MMLEYWYVFPFSVFVATFAMTTGGEGAILFVPFFLALGLDIKVAIGTAFISQLCGRISGTLGYLRTGCIQWNITIRFVLAAALFIIAGIYFTYALKSRELEFLFGLIVLALALVMLLSTREREKHVQRIESKRLTRWLWVPAVAGLFTGTFGIGTGTMGMVLLERVLKLDMRKAVATIVTTVMIDTVPGVLVAANFGNIRWDIALFSISGVLVGGQIGPWLSGRMKPEQIKLFFAILTIVVGITMCARAAGLWG